MGLCGKDPTKAPGLFPTLFRELNPCQVWYCPKDKVTQRVIDVPASFGPTGMHVIFFKLILTLLALGSLAYCFYKADNKIYFFAKFTNIALILQCLYHLLSLLNSMCPTLRQPKEDDPAAGRARSTWYFFNLSAHASILAAILWWFQHYSPGDDKLSLVRILPHGPVSVLVLLDGLWINRIPVRIFHWWSAVLPLDLAYVGWTLVHSYLEIGNPEESHDSIYEKIDWKGDFVDALVSVVIVLFVVGPIIQFFLFLFSLYSWGMCCLSDRRRYTTSAEAFVEQQASQQRTSIEEKSTAQSSVAEEGSIFATWG